MAAIEKVLSVLDLLSAHPLGLRVRDVSESLRINASHASRMLAVLARSGYVERLPSGSFVVGHRSRSLSQAYAVRYPRLEQAEEAVRELTAKFPFAGFIGTLVGDQHVILNVTRGPYRFHMLGCVNEARPAIDTAAGRAMLARMPDADALRAVGPSITGQDTMELLASLRAARERQVVYKPSTRLQGVTAVAAAVSLPAGHGSLSLCLCWPDEAVAPRLISRMADEVLRQAEALGSAG